MSRSMRGDHIMERGEGGEREIGATILSRGERGGERD
jgi:hypothetical protein